MSPVPLHASFSDSTRKRTASKFHKPNPLASVVKIAVPGIIAAAFIYKYITQKGKKPASAGQQGSESKKTATAPRKTTQKPRKDVKVKRDPEAAAEAREIAREQEATGLTHDDEMEVYNEDEVEQLQGAVGSGDGPEGPGVGGDANFIKMLQSLGYKMVVANDGSGQVFMIPPGADAPPGQEAVEEGDEEGDEGYDEDEDPEEDEA